MLCNAHDDMSNFSIRSKHQRCYIELARHRGLLGRASTPLSQSIDGTTKKYAARSCPWIFKSTNEYITTKRN